MKKLLLLLCLTLPLTQTWADDANDTDEDERIDNNYARNYSIEINGGPRWNLRRYNNAPSMAVGFMGDHCLGGGIQARFTAFIDKHWGVHLSAEYNAITDDSNSLLYKHASNSYNYQTFYVSRDIDEWVCGWCNAIPQYGQRYFLSMAGATYRYDFARHWSLRTRLSLGFQQMQPNDFYYARWDRDLPYQTEEASLLNRPNSFEEVKVTLCNNNHTPVNRFWSLAYSPSIQICFTPKRTIFFSLEAQWTGTARSMTERIEVYDIKQTVTAVPDSPEEFLQYHNIITSPDKGYYCNYYNSKTKEYTPLYIQFEEQLYSTSYHRVRMGNFLNLRIGFGWNIGRTHK